MSKPYSGQRVLALTSHPFIAFTSLICSSVLPSGGQRYCVARFCFKWMHATAEAVEKWTWDTDSHVWTQTGTYVTLAVPSVKKRVCSFHSSCFLLPPSPLDAPSPATHPHSIQRPCHPATRHIHQGDPINRCWPFFPIHLAEAHKWSYCLCNDWLIGSFGCLLCYCSPIGAREGALTVYGYMWERLSWEKGGNGEQWVAAWRPDCGSEGRNPREGRQFECRGEVDEEGRRSERLARSPKSN